MSTLLAGAFWHLTCASVLPDCKWVCVRASAVLQEAQHAAQLQQALHASNNEALRRRQEDGQLIQEGRSHANQQAERAQVLQADLESQLSGIAALQEVGIGRWLHHRKVCVLCIAD